MIWEVAWEEISARGAIVSKRKAFRSEKARDAFIGRLVEKDGFWRILGIR